MILLNSSSLKYQGQSIPTTLDEFLKRDESIQCQIHEGLNTMDETGSTAPCMQVN